MEQLKEEDFLVIMDLIDGAYQNFKLTENVMKTYYYFLKDYKNKNIWYAVTYWIKHNDFAPTIKNLVDMLGD